MKKCSNCPFVEEEGTYEYPEAVCPFFGYDVPEEFDSEDHEGCNLRFSEAKKLKRLRLDEFDCAPDYWFRQMVDEDYEPTEEDLAEEKELRKKREKKEELYKAYFEELERRRKKGD